MEKEIDLMTKDELAQQVADELEIEQESHGKVVSLTYYRVFHRIFTEYMAVNGGKYTATFAGYLRELEEASM